MKGTEMKLKVVMPIDEVKKIITEKVQARLGEASNSFKIIKVSPKYEGQYDNTEFAGFEFDIEI